VERALLKVDLIPAKRYQLGDAQGMAIGQEDQRSVAVSIPARTPRSVDHRAHFGRSEVFAGAALGVGLSAGRTLG
jgi:hypothetical protein